jgi:hypothetical protein
MVRLRISHLAAPAALAGGLLTAGPAAAATSGTWAVTGSMAATRYLDTATLLPDGQVLVAGGDTARPPARSCTTRPPGPGARPAP